MARFSFRPTFTLRGRDFHGLRGWSGKPMHPPVTDIPIGAYVLAAVFDIVSVAGRNQDWGRDFYRAANFALLAGAAVSLLAALTGWLDWRTTQKGTQVRRTANAHAWTMLSVTGLVLTGIAARVFAFWDETSTPILALALSLAAAGLTVMGAAMGGSIVYDYGFNVENAGDHPAYHPSDDDLLPGERPGQPARVSGPAEGDLSTAAGPSRRARR
ncbi:MAG: DUF2231 domain-containing protein [Acidimicrobiales bacterium]